MNPAGREASGRVAVVRGWRPPAMHASPSLATLALPEYHRTGSGALAWNCHRRDAVLKEVDPREVSLHASSTPGWAATPPRS